MAYIGKQPAIGNFVKLDAISVVNGQASYTMQNGGANFTEYSNVNQFLVSLNGILQSPTDSFTVSGSTITFASNLVTGDVIDFIMVLGNTLDVGTVSDNTISTAKLQDSSVSLAKLTATGTKDATTFLRGDNTFAEAGGTNTPAFEAYLGGTGGQSVSDNTVTLVQANTEVYDTDSAYDTSTYRFTPQVAGKYLVYGSIQNESGSGTNLNASYLYFKKNGTNILETSNDYYNNQIRADIITGDMIVDMNGSTDYVELYGRIDSISGSGQLFESDTQFKRATHFGAYKIIE